MPAPDPFRWWLRAPTLRHFSLVNSELRHEAQRELCRHIVLKSEHSLQLFLDVVEKKPHLGRFVKTINLSLAGATDGRGVDPRLGELVRGCPELEELRLTKASELDISPLSQAANLSRLLLSHCSFAETPGTQDRHPGRPAHVPLLSRLTHFSAYHTPSAHWHALLHHGCPSLEVVAVDQEFSPSTALAAQLRAVLAFDVSTPSRVGPLGNRPVLPALLLAALCAGSESWQHNPVDWPSNPGTPQVRVLLSTCLGGETPSVVGIIGRSLPELEEAHVARRLLRQSGLTLDRDFFGSTRQGLRMVGFDQDASEERHATSYVGHGYFFRLADKVLAGADARDKVRKKAAGAEA